MLHEDTPALFTVEEDDQTKQAFLRRVTNKSLIHKTTLFKDTSCLIDDSVIYKNVQIGSNCKISGCVILGNVTIGDNSTLVNTFVNFKASVAAGSTHANTEIMLPKKTTFTNEDGGPLTTQPDEDYIKQKTF